MDQTYQSENSRYVPSSLPIRSPSPDTKNANKITKTVSPVAQIKKHMTPSMNRKNTDELESLREENEELRSRVRQLEKLKMGDTYYEISRLREKIVEQERIISNYRYENQKVNNSYSNSNNMGSSIWRDNPDDLRAKLIEKDKIINELKKVLATLSENERQKSVDLSYSGTENELREKLKVLTFENQKLGEMVRKLKVKENTEKIVQENKSLENKIEFLMIENNELEQKIQRFRSSENEEIVELSRTNNSLVNQLKSLTNYEQKNKSLEKQNQKLIRMLKEQRDSQRNLNTSLYEQEMVKLQNEIKTLRERTNPEKMTISKIREQYQENLKIFQDRVYDEVNKQFSRMYQIMKSQENRINYLSEKIAYLEQKTPSLIRLSKSKESSPIISKFTVTKIQQSNMQQTRDYAKQRDLKDFKSTREKQRQTSDRKDQRESGTTYIKQPTSFIRDISSIREPSYIKQTSFIKQSNFTKDNREPEEFIRQTSKETGGSFIRESKQQKPYTTHVRERIFSKQPKEKSTIKQRIQSVVYQREHPREPIFSRQTKEQPTFKQTGATITSNKDTPTEPAYNTYNPQQSFFTKEQPQEGRQKSPFIKQTQSRESTYNPRGYVTQTQQSRVQPLPNEFSRQSASKPNLKQQSQSKESLYILQPQQRQSMIKESSKEPVYIPKEPVYIPKEPVYIPKEAVYIPKEQPKEQVPRQSQYTARDPQSKEQIKESSFIQKQYIKKQVKQEEKSEPKTQARESYVGPKQPQKQVQMSPGQKTGVREYRELPRQISRELKEPERQIKPLQRESEVQRKQEAKYETRPFKKFEEISQTKEKKQIRQQPKYQPKKFEEISETKEKKQQYKYQPKKFEERYESKEKKQVRQQPKYQPKKFQEIYEPKEKKQIKQQPKYQPKQEVKYESRLEPKVQPKYQTQPERKYEQRQESRYKPSQFESKPLPQYESKQATIKYNKQPALIIEPIKYQPIKHQPFKFETSKFQINLQERYQPGEIKLQPREPKQQTREIRDIKVEKEPKEFRPVQSYESRDLNPRDSVQTTIKESTIREFRDVREIKQTSTIMARDTRDLDRLRQENLRQTNQNLEMAERYNKLVEEYNILREDRNQILQEMYAANDHLKEYREEYTQHRLRQEELNREVDEIRYRAEAKMNEQVKRLKNASEREVDRIKGKYESEVEELKRNTEQQITRLIDTYNQEIMMLRSNIESKNKDIIEINKEVQIIQQNHYQAIRDKENLIQQIKQQLAEKSEELRIINDYRREIEQEQTIRKRSYTELQAKFAFLNERIYRLTQEKQKLIGELQQAEDQNQNLVAQNTELKSENSMIPQLKQRLQSLQDELLRVQENLEQKRSQIKNINQENSQLSEQNSKLGRELNHIKNTIQILNSQIDELKRQIVSRHNYSQELLQIITEQLEKINGSFIDTNLEEALRNLAIRIAKCEQERSSYSAKYVRAMKQLESYKLKFVQASQRLIVQQNEMNLMAAKIEYLTKANESKESECSSLRNLIDTYIKSDRIDWIEQQISASEHKSSKIELSELQYFKTEYNQAIQKLNALIEQILSKYNNL